MPIYEMTIKGADKPRMVRAATAAQASAHIVTAKAITAERADDLVQDGIALERAAEPTAPAAEGDAQSDTKDAADDAE